MPRGGDSGSGVPRRRHRRVTPAVRLETPAGTDGRRDAPRRVCAFVRSGIFLVSRDVDVKQDTKGEGAACDGRERGRRRAALCDRYGKNCELYRRDTMIGSWWCVGERIALWNLRKTGSSVASRDPRRSRAVAYTRRIMRFDRREHGTLVLCFSTRFTIKRRFFCYWFCPSVRGPRRDRSISCVFARTHCRHVHFFDDKLRARVNLPPLFFPFFPIDQNDSSLTISDRLIGFRRRRCLAFANSFACCSHAMDCWVGGLISSEKRISCLAV